MAGKRLQDVAASVLPKCSCSLAAPCDRNLEPFLQATGRRLSNAVGKQLRQRSTPPQLPMGTTSLLWQQPSSTTSSQQEHGSLFDHMPTATGMQTPMVPAAAAATAGAGMRTQISAATRCRQHSDDGEEVTSLPSSAAAAAAAVAAAFATTDETALPAAAAPAAQATASSPSTPAAAAAPDAQQQLQQQQQQVASPAAAAPQAASLPAGCRVLLTKALTRSDATAKRVILRCKQVELALGSRPVGQGHKLSVGLPCGSSCNVMVRAWANGSNTKPMYVLEQVDQLFRQQQLAAGDHVSLLVSGDGRQHFLRWQRAGEAAEQLSAAAAAEPAAAVPKPAEPVAAVPVVAAVPAALSADGAVKPAGKLQPVQVQQKKELKRQRQQQQVEAARPVPQQQKLAVQPQQQEQVVVLEAAVQSKPQVQPQVVTADQQQHEVGQQQQQQQDDQDAALLLLPLVGSTAMDCALRTGCYLLCLQQGCMQPACLGCMGCTLHKRRRVA